MQSSDEPSASDDGVPPGSAEAEPPASSEGRSPASDAPEPPRAGAGAAGADAETVSEGSAGEGVSPGAALEQLGYARPPELLEDLAAVVRRGHSVAALAGEGSGKEALYALAAVERADPRSPSVQGLVLSPTREGAIRAGRALHLLGAPEGLEALAWLPWRRPDEEGGRPFAQLMAGRPAELLPQVRAGRLKLGDLRVVAVDGAGALADTDQWEAAASILDTLPGDAQKIVTDVERGERFDDLLTHQLGRARKWPPELFQREPPAREPTGPPVLAAAAADEEERIDRLADTLHHAVETSRTDRAGVLCGDGDAAHRVAASLAARGLRLTDDPDEPGIVVAWGDEPPLPDAVCVLYGLPASLQEMRRWLGEAPARAAVVSPGELPQLRLLARRAGWRLQSVPEPVPAEARDAVEQFRDRVRRRVREHRDWTDLLLLEPLFREFGASRVAAALSGRLRAIGPAGRAEGAGAAGEGERAPAPGERREGPRRTPADATRAGSGWMRLYINAGDRDDVGPGDLVGAITGETSAVGGQIGRIDVRHSYSLVDVDPEVADEVMERLTGATIKGREVVARPDRES